MHRLFSLFSLGLMISFASSIQAQDATTPPANEHAVLTVQGRGVQIYTCTPTPTGSQWVFVAPAARLFNQDGVVVGTHGDGPVWYLQDGSSVTGQVVAKTPAADASSVPWLLLKAASRSGAGVFGSVDFVRRSETKGGAAPKGACDVGALTRVPYEATYSFYSSK
jgi:hypothetical protein